jgi:hypothetical protein
MNEPVAGWYWRAPRLVRPVAGSAVPPAKAFCPAGKLAGAVPRGLPYGS